jgi:hypothetical protein
MSIRRAAATIGAMSVGLIALTACDKPTAEATVTVGGNSVQAEAASKCYANGTKLPQDIFIACLQTKPTHHITVPLGDKVRIGVDPSIGDKGWLVVQGTTLVSPELIKNETYMSFDSAALFSQQDSSTGATTQATSVTLSIVESGDTTGSKTYRVIQFTLNRPK